MKKCKCGCGQPTGIIKKNNLTYGYIKGDYYDYLPHHHQRNKKKSFIQREKMSESRKKWYKNNPEKAKLKAIKVSKTKKEKGTHKGKNNPNYGSGRFAGKRYEGEPWNKGLTKDTSKILEKISKKNLAEKNPNWRGGISFEPYPIIFNDKFKRFIRKRDNQICMLCGTHREKLNRALHIHHINYNKLLTIPQNCISLCTSCHIKTNWNRKHWVKFFQSLLSEKYSYKYSEDGEIIINSIEMKGGLKWEKKF